MPRPLVSIHNPQGNNLTHAHPKTHSELRDGIKHRTSQRLRFLGETVAHDDEAYREEHIAAKRGEDLRPEFEIPVLPVWIDDGHHQGRHGADERGAGDEPARGEAVDEEADCEVDEGACYEIWEEIEGGS